MASTAVESGDERLNLRKNVKKANGSGKLEQNGELKVPGVDGKQDGNGTPSIPLTPRSRSPVGLISYHEKYRYFIHKHEIPRKVLHVSIGFLTLALYLRGIQLSQVTPILVALLAIIVSLDLLRFRSKKFSEYYITGFGFLMRESEVDKWNGIVFYLLGLIIVFILFPKVGSFFFSI